MKKWIIRLGFILMFIALLSISPLQNYLPIDVNIVEIIKNIFNNQQETTQVFNKVVPQKNSTNYFFIVTFISGLTLTVSGVFLKKKNS